MTIEDRVVRCLVKGDAQLGEGPVWVAAEGALYWVDILRPRIFRWTEATGAVDSWIPPFQVASLAPAAGGGFIAGTAQGFAHIDPAQDRYRVIGRPDTEPSGNRFNDGKVDRHGRFWAGTMDAAEQAVAGTLYRYGDGASHTSVDTGYRVSNGPAFDCSGGRMYHTDSGRQTIFAFDLDGEGVATGKRVFARFESGHGYPDGMTVDAEDCLWVAFWDGWCVRRFDPEGRLLGEIPMPVARPTSCVFGGAALRTLFVTSARTKLSEEQLAAQPLAGSLFAIEQSIQGVADVAFAGFLAA